MSSPIPPSHPSIRTLSIGGATFDLFVRTDATIVEECGGRDIFALPLGDKMRINDVISTAGGGASNTAVGFARLGCDAGFCGVIGDDQWGASLLQNFDHEHVACDSATIVEGETTSFSLILSAGSGERVILTHPGSARHLQDVTFDQDAIADVDAVFLNHLHRESCVIENEIITQLEAHPDIHLSWNPGGNQIECGMGEEHIKKLLTLTDVLFLNKEEALAFTQATDTKAAMKTLIAAGVSIVCITDGKNGAMATDGKTVYHCPIIDAPVIDTTGAGDAFGTGVSWALLCGKDLPTSLTAGTINATSVVGVIGAQPGLLTASHMESELNRHTLHITSEPF